MKRRNFLQALGLIPFVNIAKEEKTQTSFKREYYSKPCLFSGEFVMKAKEDIRTGDLLMADGTGYALPFVVPGVVIGVALCNAKKDNTIEVGC